MSCNAHLELLAVNIDQPLPEVHPDRGLCLLWELSGAKAVRQACLANPRVPDNDDFKDSSPRRRKASGARQRAGEFTRRKALCHGR